MSNPARKTGATPPAEPPPLDWLDPGVQARVREAVAAREAYRDGGGPLEMVQTHISTVFLGTDYVFKFKRPVSLGFVDFSTLAARRRYCEAEVTLNRRLAPDVYLDVLPLTAGSADGASGALRLGGEGAVVDYCVVMRRLPREDALDERLRAGRVDRAGLEALAGLLADFHALEPGPDVARFGSLEVVRGNWEENFEQTEPLVGEALPPQTLARIRHAVRDFMARNEALFAERVAEGHVRDGHGDLRCEHVYVSEDGIRVIDCVEFNDRFRYGDAANDLAFLLMDICDAGRPDLARELMARYVARTGDRGLVRLAGFYGCYRAYVRGKVTSFLLQDPGLGAERAAMLRQRARRLYRLAEELAGQMEPRAVVIMCGLTGTGKSAMARGLAERTGAVHLSSDAIRKELAGEAAASGREAGFGEGIYSAEWNRRTYEALFERADAALRHGQSVILDATFSRRGDRGRARELAGAFGARTMVVECTLPEAVALERLEARQRKGTAVSDGRPEVYRQQQRSFEPIEPGEADAHVQVDTSGPREASLAALLRDERVRVPPPLFVLAG